MKSARIIIVLALLVIVGVPVVSKWSRTSSGAADAVADGAPKLVVVTPHIEQIRLEFGMAFDAWHRRIHGTSAVIDWRTPGGTSEIRKLLESQAEAAVAAGAYTITPPKALKNRAGEKEELPEAVIDAERADLPDVFFGGGSFEHTASKVGIVTTVTIDGRPTRVRVRISAPPTPPFTPAYLDGIYGPENRVGVERLYDDDQHWFGTALSGFGIVYNRDLLGELGVPEPTSFGELGDPRLFRRVALADPRLSGSVATLYDAILNKEGWDRGWRILREMSANARYFSSSSTQPPLDVSQGECAAGVAIDFYGRGQSQSLIKPGDDPSSSRVGYIDPPGATYIDADPASIINGARHAELARRFVEFCLTDEAQALWQFAPLDQKPGAAGDGLGPQHDRLRRMPVKPSMYANYLDRFTDQTNAFEIASKTPLRGWRDLIGPLMGAFAIDTHREMQDAWRVLNAARAKPGFPPTGLALMEEAFYSMPMQAVDDGVSTPAELTLNEANYKAIAAFTGRWRDAEKGARAKIAYTRFYQQQYRLVAEIASKHGVD
ncbi:MAG: extracellular solute-binding protein [Phycisphaerales bacterium]|nr:extracellular solute-binding protein [Phycisphaerales bacterium]